MASLVGWQTWNLCVFFRLFTLFSLVLAFLFRITSFQMKWICSVFSHLLLCGPFLCPMQFACPVLVIFVHGTYIYSISFGFFRRPHKKQTEKNFCHLLSRYRILMKRITFNFVFLLLYHIRWSVVLFLFRNLSVPISTY